MTIHRHDGKVQMECDHKGCKKTFDEYASKQFLEMQSDARKNGWVTFQNNAGKWVNFCCWLHSDLRDQK